MSSGARTAADKLRFAIVFAALCAAFAGVAQIPMDMAHGHETLKEAIKLWEAEDTEKAASMLASVHRSDSLYARCNHARTRILIDRKEYEKALAVCEQMLLEESELSATFLILRAALLVDLERFPEALTASDTAMSVLPGAYRPRHLKVIALTGTDKKKEAFELAMDNARKFPYHREAHVALGRIANNEGSPAQAALALMMAQVVRWEDETAEGILGYYDDILGGRSKPEKEGFDMSLSGDMLEEEDLLIRNQVAMDRKYKVKPDLTYPMCRQSHMLFTSVKQKGDTDKGFYSSFYGPMAKYIMDNDLFEGFVYHCLTASTQKEINSVAAKNKSKVADFRKSIGNFIADRYMYSNSEDGQEILTIYNDEGDLLGMGPVDRKADKLKGDWTYFHTNGRISAKGSFNGEGKKNGPWKYWYDDGNLKSTVDVVDGTTNGKLEVYYANGTVGESSGYVNDKYENEFRSYHPLGGMKLKKNAVGGVWNGKTTEYHLSGAPAWEYDQKEGKAEGMVKQFFPSGTVEYEGNYKAGQREGTHVQYHPDGTKSSEYNFTAGLSDGPFKEWYPNGKLEVEGTFKGDKLVGERRKYDEWGSLTSIDRYDDQGRLHGLYEEFNDEGGKYIEMTYKNGLLIAYKYFDRTGKVTSEGTRSKGKFQFKGMSPEGVTMIEGIYLDEGVKDGVWKFYQADGTIDSEETNKNGKAIGSLKNYDTDGTLLYENIVYDRPDGSYRRQIGYYNSGKIRYEGQLKDGENTGVFKFYYPDGTLKSVQYYVDGEFEGWQSYYDPKGVLHSEENVSGDITHEHISYDENGKMKEHIKIQPGQFEFVTHFSNGKPARRLTMMNGIEHGKATWYYPDGKVNSEGEFFNGERHGKWIWNHPNGKRYSETEYIHGKIHGTEKDWFDDGTLETEATWVNGQRHGDLREYHRTGKISFLRKYENGELHGPHTAYDHSGTPMMTRVYHKDRLIGFYAAADGSGEMTRVSDGVAELVSRYPNGKIARKMTYRNGELEGELEEYHANGQLLSKGTFKAGEEHGRIEDLYSNGKPFEVRDHIEGERHGEFLRYWDNGQLRDKLIYVNGNVHGEGVQYDRNGKVILRYKARNGNYVEFL